MNAQDPPNDFASLLNTTLALIFVLTPQGLIVNFNRACEIMTGYTFEEVKNRPFWAVLLLPNDALATAAAFSASNIGYFLNQREGYWLNKAGARRFVEWSNTAIIDDEGIVKLLVGTGIDVTEKKEAQQRSIELEIQQAKARELATFVGRMSHDIRTPLTTLMISSHLLSRQNKQVQLIPQIEMVQHETKYLGQLIDDTQLVFDLFEGELPDIEWIHLPAMLKELQIALAERIVAKKLEYHLDLPEDAIEVSGNRSFLHRAIYNVLDNAIRYTPEQGVITIRMAQHDAMVLIEVCDTGIGISAEDLPHIFEYFYKADKARTAKGAGSGLGLTIAKQVIQLHQGAIEVDSEPGQGTTVRLMLPGKIRQRPQ
jgi:PAS domain S-box-containing protein